MRVWSWRQAIEKSETLKPNTKLLLLILANYMNEHGEGCYPSVAKIAKACGFQERAVYRHIDFAIEQGFLIKSKRKLRGSQWASNEYKATYPSGVSVETSHDKQWGVTSDRSGVSVETGCPSPLY